MACAIIFLLCDAIFGHPGLVPMILLFTQVLFLIDMLSLQSYSVRYVSSNQQGDTTPLLQQAPMRQLRHSLHISGKQDSYSVDHKDDDCIRNAASLQIEAASHWRIVPSNSKHMPEGARTISISGLLTNGDERGTRRPHHHQRFMLIIFHPRRKSLTKNGI